jgi:hypothetical protein
MKRKSLVKGVLFVSTSICAILFAVGPAHAEDIYYAQAPTGSGSGVNCVNAKAISDLTWGPGAGNIGAGDTAHLCGTITTAIAVGASGSDANNKVTVKLEDNAKMSKDTWGDGGAAITVNGKNWVVIDGGTNGIIESTAVGSAKTYQHNNTGVEISGTSSDIEVVNLTIPQLYSRARSNSADFAGSGIKLNQGTLSNIRIHHNTLSRAEVLIYVMYGAHNNIRIYNNNLTHGAAGIIVGDPTSNSTIDTVELYNNTINLYDDAADLNCTNTYHNDGIHFWAVASGSSYRNVRIHGNTIGPDMGACTATTGWIFLEDTRSNILIYNNLLLANDSNQCPTDAMIYDKSDGSAANNGAQIYNNTLAFAVGSNKGCTGLEVQEGGEIVKNNIFMNLDYAVFGGPIASPFTSDYNLYYNNGNNVEGKSNEPHGIFRMPSLDANYWYFSDTSPGVNAGVDVSAFFTTDKDGNARTVPWDIGAYEYTGAITPTGSSSGGGGGGGCSVVRREDSYGQSRMGMILLLTLPAILLFLRRTIRRRKRMNYLEY